MEKIENIEILKKFNYNDKVAEIAKNIIERMDANTYEELADAIDCELIYYCDQWKLAEYYISPADIGSKTFDDILNCFTQEIAELLEI